MSAMVATPCTAFDSSWYLDFGAVNHLTLYASNLINKMNYSGNELINVGDETSMNIHHIGSPLAIRNSIPNILRLNQLLHVPSIIKNFPSLSRFVADNGVFFDFFSKHCYVKDQITRNIVMAEKLKHDLYVFDPPLFQLKPALTVEVNSPSANLSNKRHCCNENEYFVTSVVSFSSSSSVSSSVFTLWHNKLGQPATPGCRNNLVSL